MGQNWELNVPLPGGELIDRDIAAGAESFEDEHERFYGYSIPGEELELLTFNVAAVGTRHSVELPKLAGGPQPEPIDRRGVVFSGRRRALSRPPSTTARSIPGGHRDRRAGGCRSGRRDDAAPARERRHASTSTET